MSTLGSGSFISPAAAAPAPAVEDTSSSSWAPHGAALTAFVVGINLLMIALIFFFFWRFFSGKRGESSSGSDGADDGSLPVASPWASRHRRREPPRAKPLDVVASALPVYVYSAAAEEEGGGTTKAPAECAVCIVELRDGDSARRLPRCGHRFHSDCVGAWLRIHATCPLCRATVVAPKAAAAAAGEARNGGKGGGDVGADSAV